jgi:hypothetical protein
MALTWFSTTSSHRRDNVGQAKDNECNFRIERPHAKENLFQVEEKHDIDPSSTLHVERLFIFYYYSSIKFPIFGFLFEI